MEIIHKGKSCTLSTKSCKEGPDSRRMASDSRAKAPESRNTLLNSCTNTLVRAALELASILFLTFPPHIVRILFLIFFIVYLFISARGEIFQSFYNFLSVNEFFCCLHVFLDNIIHGMR